MNSILNSWSANLSEVNTAWQDMYQDRFADYFVRVMELDSKYRSRSVPISDTDLECILTELPLTLFSASEALNQLRLEYEVIKIESRNRRIKYRSDAMFELNRQINDLSEDSPRPSKADCQRAVDDEVIRASKDDETVIKIYETVISRVENEISFTKELIMAAKKLWDARRRGEQSNPIGEGVVSPVESLPDYGDIIDRR